MKRLGLGLAVALAMVAVPVVAAADLIDNVKTGDKVTISDANGVTTTTNACINGTCGGPWTATANGDSWVTFCLERGETITLGTQYWVVVNSGAVAGGGGAVNGFDALSNEAAFAYYSYRRFVNGDIASPGWNGVDLQFYLWYQEGEATENANATTVKNWIAGNMPTGWVNTNVVVLNLYDADPTGKLGDDIWVAAHKKQDQLALIPEPASMLLLGSGLLAMAAGLRRRR